MFEITKSVEFDYGHRVPDHGSKCFNPHGHRGKVIAVCESPNLIATGEQTGMVLDFGFLKRLMEDEISFLFDHNFLIFKGDTVLSQMFLISEKTKLRSIPLEDGSNIDIHSIQLGSDDVRRFWIIALPLVPTAENLAYLSFLLIKNGVEKDSLGYAKLKEIQFYETPTSKAIYRKGS